jgi:hypothetical protein
MLTAKETEELIFCDYDSFVQKIVLELTQLSLDKDLINQMLEVTGDEEIKSDFREALSQIRQDKINSVLKG